MENGGKSSEEMLSNHEFIRVPSGRLSQDLHNLAVLKKTP